MTKAVELTSDGILFREDNDQYELKSNAKSYIDYLQACMRELANNPDNSAIVKGDLAANKLRQTAAQASLTELELARRSENLSQYAT